MALGINAVWECRTTATAANVNGAGFNPESATLALTDLAATSSSGQSATPTVSSATYTFVAGDVNAYLFIQSGGTFVPGWYLITAVSAGVATLSAAIGAVVKYTSGAARSVALNTAAGCATTTTPTAGVFTIDYSQQDAAGFTLTSLTSAGAGNVVLSAAAVPTMIGNIAHCNSGTNFTTGWFEVTAVSTGVSFTLSTNQAGTAITTGAGVSGAINIGGAASLNSSAGATDDAFFENGAGTNGSGAHWFFIKNGSYATMGTITLAASGGTQSPIRVFGYNSLRTDGMGADLGSNRPILTFGANQWTFGSYWNQYNLIIVSTAASAVSTAVSNQIFYCKIINNSTTAARAAITATNNLFSLIFGSELIAYRGNAIITSSTGSPIDCRYSYIHSSNNGCSSGATTGNSHIIFWGNIFADNITTDILFSSAMTAGSILNSNTFYGAENKLGVGVSFATGSRPWESVNNIFYGKVTPVTSADVQTQSFSDYNDYFNNTNGNTNYPTGPNTLAVDPQFTNVVQRTGTTATTNTTGGNHLVDANATFVTWGISAGVDTVYIKSGTAGPVFTNYSILSVDSETQLTLGETVVANATADHVWQITRGHNFAIGTNLRALGYPGVFPGGLTTGYLDIGAAQRQESGAAGMLYVPCLQGT